MNLTRRLAGAAVLTLLTTAGATQVASAQEPDLTGVDAVIIELTESIRTLAADLGDVTEDLGQQPGIEEVLSAVGFVMSDGLTILLDTLIDAFT